MQKRQIWGLLALLLVTVFVVWSVGQTEEPSEKTAAEGESVYVQLLAATPAAQVEGETRSPNGRYEVRAVGASDSYVSGVRPPEALQIVDTETGEVLWESMGYLWQSALWSPDGSYLALAYAGRTWNHVLLFETESWTSWQFTLPDGEPIPEYTFLPYEDWGQWQGENILRLTVGWGGDSGPQTRYFCTLQVMDGALSGTTEPAEKSLPGSYDFNHDGIPEAVMLEGNTNVLEESSFWVLSVVENGEPLWSDIVDTSHAGWNSLFALELDGQDYLLRYTPSMSTGCAYYAYQIFSLNRAGEEVLLRENSVEFDVNFRPTLRNNFDPAPIAAFLEEVHSYLNESTLLISTEGGGFRTGGSGADFREDFDFWDEFCPYDEEKSLEENLRTYAELMTAARSGQA